MRLFVVTEALKQPEAVWGSSNGFEYESNCANGASGTVWGRVDLIPKQRLMGLLIKNGPSM